MEEIKYEYKEREIGHAGDGESLSRGVWKPPDVRRLFSQATWTAPREYRKAVPPIVWQNNGPTLLLTVNGIWVENIVEKMFQKKESKNSWKTSPRVQWCNCPVHILPYALIHTVIYLMVCGDLRLFKRVFQVLKIPRINQALVHAPRIQTVTQSYIHA